MMDNLKEDFVEVRVAIMAVQRKLDFVEKMPSFFQLLFTCFYLTGTKCRCNSNKQCESESHYMFSDVIIITCIPLLKKLLILMTSQK